MNYLALILTLLAPATAFAATAGTDEYLRELGYTDTQLSTEAPTEEREAFQMVEGTGHIIDPLGDVVDRFGITSVIRQPWGDISNASLQKDEAAQTWNFTIALGGMIPTKPSHNAQIFFYVDADGNKENNAPAGIRIGTDAEFSVQHDASAGWYVDFRWYNADADFWAVNKDTKATLSADGNSITLQIPFTEVTASVLPHWRGVMAVADGSKTQIDVVPGVGFPPPKDETYPTVAENADDRFFAWSIGGILLLATAYGILRLVAKKRQR